MVVIIVIILVTGCVVVSALCPAAAFAPMPFILEYVLWRGWNQVIVFSPNIEQGKFI